MKQNEETNSRFTFIDLFAGIGGFRLAFEAAGAECVFSCEINKFSRYTYYRNFNDLPYPDITTLDPETIPDHDVLTAGFPCQPFSKAGIAKNTSLGKATGFESEKNGSLFFNICDILKVKKPKILLLENVKNLVEHDDGNTFAIINEQLDSLGYRVFAKIMDSRNYVPQARERVFIVGLRKDLFPSIEFQFPSPPDNVCKLRDILDESVDDKYTLTDKAWKGLRVRAEKANIKNTGFSYSIANLDGVSRTLTAHYYSDGAEILIPQEGKNPRKMTPRECARLQGFPDSYEFPMSDKQTYQSIGNSVVVPLVTDIAKNIISYLPLAGDIRLQDELENKNNQYKFISRPFTVEAIQWSGSNDEEIISFSGTIPEYISDDCIALYTGNDCTTFHMGDYIVKGSDRFYGFTNDDFHRCFLDVKGVRYE